MEKNCKYEELDKEQLMHIYGGNLEEEKKSACDELMKICKIAKYRSSIMTLYNKAVQEINGAKAYDEVNNALISYSHEMFDILMR